MGKNDLADALGFLAGIIEATEVYSWVLKKNLSLFTGIIF